MKMRNLGITMISLVLTTIVIGNAYYQKKQFYPSVVYITKSNPSMAIIYIQAFILVILSGKLMRKVFFGELRPVELEHLMERSWYAVTETCLAFTVFRDDFSPKFVALFTLLLFLKSFHWLADERVDFMERSPVISWLFHIRIISLLLLLGSLDVAFVFHAYQSTLVKGASVQLVFGFEYAILLTMIMNIIIKYAFHINDFHELPWENKAVFLLYTELVMGFIKVLLYFAFVFIMVRIYTLPLFAFRPMYFTVRAFKKAVNDVIMSRRAINNMNTLYPDATAEELAAADNVCIICREEMHSASKKLPCNHIFHSSCLRSWFQRQQTCPTCRLNILRTPGTPAAPPNQPNPPREQQQPQGNFQWAQPANDPPPHGNNERPSQPSGSASTSSQQQSQGGAENIPFFRPPPFPYMAFNIPPPIPPSQGLSDEELRQLEQRTREGIEARLRCLQNIQCLLDASVIMMQQYSAAVAASQVYDNIYQGTTTNRSTCTTPDVETQSHERPEPSTSAAKAETVIVDQPPASDHVESKRSEQPISEPDLKSKENPDLSDKLLEPGPSFTSEASAKSEQTAGSQIPTGDDALRLRRVEKFTKN